MKVKTLTTKNLQAVFGVTAMTIYNWRKNKDLPRDPTPAQVTRWARLYNTTLMCPPRSLLGVDIGKPGPKPRSTSAALS